MRTLARLLLLAVCAAGLATLAPVPARSLDPPSLPGVPALRSLEAPAIPGAPAPLELSSLGDLGDAAGSPVTSVARPGGAATTAGAGSSPAVPPWEGGSDLTPLGLETRLRIETPRWYGDFTPLGGAGPEAFVRVHGYGAVYAMADAGNELWHRPVGSFYPEWGIDLKRVASVPMGNSPTSPFSAPENGYAVADWTGDGLDDVAVAHYALLGPGQSAAFVTLLDGADGRTLWWERFPGFVSAVVAADLEGGPGPELVAAIERTDANSALRAIALDGAPFEERTLWEHQTAHSAIFPHLEAVPRAGQRDGVAASWTTKSFGAPAPKGTFLLLDASGTAVWQKATTGWVRTFSVDPGSATLVGQEMDDRVDPTTGIQYWSYSLKSWRLSDGAELRSVARDGAIMIRLAVGDVDGDPGTEWVVSELTVTRTGRLLGTRAAAIDPDGSTRWTWEIPWDNNYDTPHGLAIVPGPSPRVVIGATTLHGDLVEGTLSLWGTRLFALDGRTGTIVWDLGERGAFPLFVVPHRAAGAAAVLVGTDGFGGRAYDPVTGAKIADIEVLAEPYAAIATDVDADGQQDLVVAGGSGAVFAYDGGAAMRGEAEILWATGTDGQVHELRLGNLSGNGAPEIVASASNQVAVLRLSDGATLWTHDRPAARPSELFWTTGVGDLNGDGLGDVVVPGQRLIALDGRDGRMLWTYEPAGAGNPSNFSTVALADANGDGAAEVAAEYSTDPPAGLAPRHALGVLLADGRTGQRLWEHRLVWPRNIAQLWRSVNVYPSADGPEFAFTYLMGQNNGVSALGAWYPRVDVYDGRTGKLDWTSGTFARGYQHTKTRVSPRGGDELFDFNWLGISRATASGIAEWDTKSLFDGEFANLVPGEDHLVVAGEGAPPVGTPKGSVEVFPASLAWGPGGNAPESMAGWDGDGSEEIEVVDLDGDGDHEILAMPFDFDAWARVLLFEGTSIGRGDSGLHGFNVIDAIPLG